MNILITGASGFVGRHLEPELELKGHKITSLTSTDFDNRNYIVSNEKLESFGWKPTYTLSQRISELIRAYKMIINNNNKNYTNL